MTFGQYIRFRREKILRQERDEISFQKGYLTSIETNARRPTKENVVQRLGKALGILDPTAQRWLWLYSLSNEEPYPFPAMYHKAVITKDDLPTLFHEQTALVPSNGSNGSTSYHITQDPPAAMTIHESSDNTHIQLNYGTSENEVLSILGAPDKKILIPARCKWIYEKEGLSLIFTEGKVTHMAFN